MFHKVIKHYLFVYPNGARGDFLTSILLGDILQHSYQRCFIDWVGNSAVGFQWKKWHGNDCMYGPGGQGPYCEYPIRDLDWFDFKIRIKLENEQQCVDVSLLAASKLQSRSFKTRVQNAIDHERQFRALDHKFDQIIPYQNLWDIDQIKILFEQHRGRSLDEQELERIQHNIDINLELLHQLRQDAALRQYVYADWRRPSHTEL